MTLKDIPRLSTKRQLPDLAMASLVNWNMEQKSFIATVADEAGSFLSCIHNLLFVNTFDIVVLTMVSVCAVCFFYYYHGEGTHKDGTEHMLAYNLNWTLMSITLVFPLTMTMSEAFRRRESALTQLVSFKSNVISLYLGHMDWDWYTIPSEKPDLPSLSGKTDRTSKEGARLNAVHCAAVRG